MVVDKLIALGVISLGDIDDVGIEPLINELKIDAGIAEKLVAAAVKEIERLKAEAKQNEAEKQLAQQTKVTDNQTKVTDNEIKVTDNEIKVTDNEQ